MAELTVKVEGSIKEEISKSTSEYSKQLETIKEKRDAKTGKPVLNTKQYLEIKENLKLIDSINKQEKITEEQYKTMNNAFKKVASMLETAVKNVANLTKEAKAAEDNLKKLQSQQNLKRSLRESGSLKKEQAKEKFTEALSRGRYITNTRTGEPITKLETVAKHYKNGKFDEGLTFSTKGGGTPSESAMTALKEAAKLYQEGNDEYKEGTKNLSELNRAIKEAEDAFNSILKKDQETGASQDIDLVQGVSETSKSMHNALSDTKTQFVDEKNKEIALNTQTNLSAISADATKAASGIGKVAKQFSLWTIGLRLARRAMSEVKSTITGLDKSLTEQAMVTGKTRKEVYGLLKDYQNLAIQLGSTTKEVSAAVTEFIRQGKSTQEAMKLAEAAISAAKVAAIDTSDSINYLTTALNGFQLSTDKAMEVSDKFAAVSANAATSYEEIAIALSKVASQANLAGMSIDYTTALLAKGLETTREAPETIGTALKTVIARMREITDYGETLEDGVDLNNVESQLAYVGIQLKNTSGELRSTEDVLDDLGKKWDSLNANQQAAIAKALAGTRQQSRLIAMMSDYERVIELQEISSRSAGATMAQIGVYAQGLEAALNRLSTSWEKIISTITNSDVIVFLVDVATGLLDTVNQIISNTWGMVAILTIIASYGVSVLTNKIQEHNMQKLILKEQLKQKVQSLEQYKTQRAISKEVALQTVQEKKKAKIQAAEAKIEAIQKKLKEHKTSNEIAEAEIAQAKLEITTAENEAELETEAIKKEYKDDMLTIDNEILKVQGEQSRLSMNMAASIMQMVPGASMLLGIFTSVVGVMRVMGAVAHKNHKQKVKDDAEETPGIFAKIFGAGAEGGIPGLAIAAGIVAALALATGVAFAIANATGAFKSADEKTADHVKELSNEIYTLTKRSEAIETAVTAVNDLDKKLIKSKEDAEKLSETLSQVGDKLSGEKDENLIQGLGMSEQEFYDQLGDAEKLKFLQEYQTEVNKKLAEDEKQLVEDLKRADWNSSNNGKMYKLQATSSVKRTAYQALDELDLSSEEASARQVILEKIIESSSDFQLKNLLGNLTEMRKILTQLGNITFDDGSVASDILQDDGASLKDRTEAFRKLKKELSGMPDVWNAIEKAYSEFNVFADWSNQTLELIEDLKITNQEINDLYTGYSKIARILKDEKLSANFSEIMNEDQYQDRLINHLLPALSETNIDVAEAMKSAFGDFLADVNAEDYEKIYTAILNQVANAVQVGVQNIGQNVDKLKSSIASIYDVAQKWDSMSSTEQSTFLSEHQDMFSGESGAVLLQAFKSKDYDQIRNALASNATLTQNRENEIKEIAAELAFEEAKIGAARNEALIQYLNERLKQLQSDDFLSIDLETLVEQENKRIEAYKELLQKEQDALQKSLEERKDAYQKYFEAVNQSAEDEDYEEKAELFVANLTKLAGSTNATAKAQTEELQNSLAELEKERLQTLRERAQEAVIQSIDDSIDEISEKFDELLANNREILNMLKGTSGTDLVASLLSTDSFAGKTANEAQLYLNEIQSTFGSQVSDIDWSNISTSVNNAGNLVLNIGDQVIELSGNEAQGRNIYEAIKLALQQNGINASI